MTGSGGSDTDGPRIWSSFVEVLSTQPDAVERLMPWHRPTAAGRCLTCAVPGGYRPDSTWPCALWTVADAARRVRARRQLDR